MHYRLYFTFNKDNAKNSEEARRWASNTLEEEGFCAQGRFTSGRADWFLVGGRWSGDLSMLKLDPKKREEFNKEVDNIKERDDKKKDAIIDKLFYQKFPEYPKQYNGKIKPVPCPYARNTHEIFGYEDDAMLITQEIYDAVFKKEREGQEDDDDHYIDYEMDTCDKTWIGTKWVCIVDYHN